MDVTRFPRAAQALLGVACLIGLLPGCSAMHSMHGVPAGYMPPEFHPESREGRRTIDLSLLQRSRPNQYQIEAGDSLTVYAPGLLGLVDTQPDQPRGDNPPINLPINPSDHPTVGYPVTVRDDHSIQLPQLPPIDVYRLTVREVEDRLRRACMEHGLLAANTQPRIVVDILRKRTTRVLVYRQEASSNSSTAFSAGTINLGQTNKGTSRVVDLPGYENDVAHALAQTGVEGLPGLDARNVIYVIRSRGGQGRTANCPTPEAHRPIIRGQSPEGWRGRAVTSSSPGQGPYDYLRTSTFHLSGEDVSRGYTGPDTNTAIPTGHSGVSGHSTAGPARSHHSPTASVRAMPVGHSIARPTAASQPTLNADPYASPYASRTSPLAGPAANPYQPVQYTPAPAYQAPQPDPTPVQPDYAGGPTMPLQPNYQPAPAYSVNPSVAPQPNYTPTFAPGMPSGAPYAPQFDMEAPLPMVDTFQEQQVWSSALQQFDPTVEGDHVVKIPVRLAPGETLDITEEDVILYDGDIVFIENRETDVYYIGGLLGGGQYTLPRDKDLHVLEALSLAQGQNSTQAGSQGLQSSGGVSALNRDVVPSASRVLILRQVHGQQVNLEVNLYRALRYPHENIVIQPGDMLILQYTKFEAFGAFIQRNIFEGALLGIAAGSLQTGGGN